MADQPILSVQSCSKRFGALIASDAVTLDLFPGEIHALIGPNGAGKSTLIKQIAGEIKPDAGTVSFNGRDMGGLSAASRAQMGLARSFQVSALALELTALQNVMLAIVGRQRAAFRLFRRAQSDRALAEEATQILHRVGLLEEARKSAAILAHGQRRLLEVACALALKPKAFLLDEPMAGLGDSGSKQLTTLLDALRAEAPILLVEHDMDAVFALADRISVLVYGRVIATGTVAEIKANAEVQAAYLGEDSA